MNFSRLPKVYSKVYWKKYKKYFIVINFWLLIWGIFIQPYLQENLGLPAMTYVESNVKELPEKGAKIVAQLKENIEATIIENTNYYYKVTFTDEDGVQREGYVAKRNLKIIKEPEAEEIHLEFINDDTMKLDDDTFARVKSPG